MVKQEEGRTYRTIGNKRHVRNEIAPTTTADSSYASKNEVKREFTHFVAGIGEFHHEFSVHDIHGISKTSNPTDLGMAHLPELNGCI